MIIDCEDSVLSDFINLFADLFIGKIVEGIQTSVEGVMDRQIPGVLNKRFIKHQGIRHWSKKMDSALHPLELDMSIPYNWKITEDRITIYYNAETYVPGRRVNQPEQMPPLPEWNDTLGETYPIQAFAGSYMLNSLV